MPIYGNFLQNLTLTQIAASRCPGTAQACEKGRGQALDYHMLATPSEALAGYAELQWAGLGQASWER